MNAKRMAAVVDTHTSGAPTRIIVGGGPLLKGETFADRWLDFKENQCGNLTDMIICSAPS